MVHKAAPEVARERLYLFDTTLRDGAQTNGVDFTLADKLAIAKLLDELGVDYVEGGYPGANPTDTEFFGEDRKLARATFTAFGMTRRPGRSASNDPGLGARGAARLRAFLRLLQCQSGVRARLRQGGLRRGRALGRAVRHQWRRAAARGRADRRRGGQAHSRQPCRHP